MPAPLTDQDHKLRARRRLIGAVALDIFAVILLPLVLEDEPPPAGPLDVRMPPPPAVPPASESTVEYAPPPANTTVEPQASGEEATPANPPAPEREEVAVAPSIPPAKPAEPAKALASGQQSETYTIQVGVFSDKANVQKVQSRISGLGFKSYTEQVKNSTRVRVGAFSSRSEADAVAAKLAAGGVAGKVVEK